MVMSMNEELMKPGLPVVITSPVLQELNEQVVTILENMSDAFFALDSQWQLVYLNRMAEQVFGSRRENFLGRNLWEVFPEAVGGVFYQEFHRAVAEGTTVEFEAFGSGLQKWLEVRAHPSRKGLSVFFRDVTGRRVTSMMRHYMEALIAASSDAIIGKTLDGRVICWNKGAEHLYEFTAEEMLGESVSIIIPPERRHEMEEIVQCICRGECVERYETVRLRKDGTPIDVSLTASPIKDAKGVLIGVAVIAHDITGRKRIEKEQREKEQRKDDFIGIASHELKTPITSIKVMTQLLQLRLAKEGNTEAVRSLERMDKQIDRLNRLVSDLLDVTKIQEGKLELLREIFNFDEWLRNLIEDLQQTTTHKINCSGKVGRGIVADRDRIGQVVTNLITNAIKYSPQADTIDVRVMADQNGVVVSVQDYGIGIPAASQEMIFTRFFRVLCDRTVPGLGMGLFIAAEIVKLHGGTIRVESVEGKGSIFSFSIPSPALDVVS